MFIDSITEEKIIFVESNLKNNPIIISYNHCPENISIESFSKDLTFHYKQELNVLPVLIENAILKTKPPVIMKARPDPRGLKKLITAIMI